MLRPPPHRRDSAIEMPGAFKRHIVFVAVVLVVWARVVLDNRRVNILFPQQAPFLFFLIDGSANGVLVLQRLGVKPVVAPIGR